MEVSPQLGTVCSTCGEPLNASGGCLSCLLRIGIEETAAAEPSEPSPPTTYGDFEIARREDGSLWELGRGAMGVTYKAIDRVLHRAVALKVIQLGAARDDDPAHKKSEALRERFLREARAAAALRHSNVAAIFHFGASAQAERCFYAMELVEGETLEARVRRDGPLDVADALEVAWQVCAALVAAADRGLVHRDLKPGNLMLTGGGGGGSGGRSSSSELEVKVIDFGLAKAAAAIGEADLTRGGFVGTPAFASPEQFGRGAGAAVDARSDLYSLGITLWFALTGRVPFTGRTLAQLRDDPARAHLPVEQLTARGVPACVTALLRRVLAIDPAERPASARELLDALDACRQRLRLVGNVPAVTRRRLAPVVAAAAVLVVLAAAASVWRWTRSLAAASHRAAVVAPALPPTPALPSVAEKSLAVLPFDNFSEDKDSAFFADGVQDEVLTDLAKVADLKVISRSSVMQYKDTRQRNLREIGQALGVAYVVEGSVQRAGNKIKVTAQLIDARTDAHRWAEQYVRDLADVFAIQGEIAQAIAGQLQAAVSPRERAEIEDMPTHDEQAYQLYLRAVALYYDGDQEDSDGKTMDLLKQATARDPSFARAFLLMTRMQSIAYYTGDRLPADKKLLQEYAETTAHVRPGSAEANLAMGLYDYYGCDDYRRAHDEFTEAARQSPNNAWSYHLLGMIERHRGQWDDAVAHMHRALELDPENIEAYHFYSYLLEALGRYPESLALTDRRIASHPTFNWLHIHKANTLIHWKADVRAARAELALLPPGSNSDGFVTFLRLRCDLIERDYAAAARDLAASPAAEVYDRPREFYEGDIARFRGDTQAAARIYTAVRTRIEADVRANPKDCDIHLCLAQLDALLGHKEMALEEGRRGRALIQDDDTLNAPTFIARWMKVLNLAGAHEEAIRTLQTLHAHPFGPSYGDLRADPDFDALRGDPRFTAIEASLAPK